MPRSSSSLFESIETPACPTPVCCKMASVRVVFPWSTCAIIAIFRISIYLYLAIIAQVEERGRENICFPVSEGMGKPRVSQCDLCNYCDVANFHMNIGPCWLGCKSKLLPHSLRGGHKNKAAEAHMGGLCHKRRRKQSFLNQKGISSMEISETSSRGGFSSSTCITKRMRSACRNR